MNAGYGAHRSHPNRLVAQARHTARHLGESLRRAKPASDDQLCDWGFGDRRATARQLLHATSTDSTHRVLRDVDVPVDAVFGMVSTCPRIRRNRVYARRCKREERWPAVPPPFVVERSVGDLQYRILFGGRLD